MPGFPRDLAAADPWDNSLARSRARREQAARKRAKSSPTCLSNLIDTRNRVPSVRDLEDSEPWNLSLLRSRTRRRAAELQFVPTASRARRVSLGTLIAIAAGPAAGLADAGATGSAPTPTPEPTTTTEHHIRLEEGSEGRQVRLLQRALGVPADGMFGARTAAALRAFQASHGLTTDGVLGARTSAALAGNAPSAVPAAAVASTAIAHDTAFATASAHSAIDPVTHLQTALHIQADGTFGPETEAAVKHLQASHGLTVDGVVGPETWNALGIHEHATLTPPPVAHRHSHAHHSSVRSSSAHAASGDSHGGGRVGAITRLQAALHLEADGTFGPETEQAIKHLQASHGLTVDGVVGPETWDALGLSEGTTLHPPSALSHKSSSSDSTNSTSSEGSSVVSRVIAAADEIATRPYVYGGGHGSFESTGYDCSGSVSYALHGGGLLSSPEDSSALESYGDPGPGSHITIYANAEHAWMVIDGRRYDTIAQQETGSRWSDSMMSTAGYVVRHPAGL
jgi:peptidoglycan hydrolase-like protein with peptidoglycan-binding domain